MAPFPLSAAVSESHLPSLRQPAGKSSASTSSEVGGARGPCPRSLRWHQLLARPGRHPRYCSLKWLEVREIPPAAVANHHKRSRLKPHTSLTILEIGSLKRKGESGLGVFPEALRESVSSSSPTARCCQHPLAPGPSPFLRTSSTASSSLSPDSDPPAWPP